MRSRYSRRIYSMKFGTEKSDFIDDEDIKFLQRLSSLHKSYVNNLHKKLKLDVSLLNPKFVKIYEKVSKHYSLVKTSEEHSDLYHNFDLRYEGEEMHIRNIREQITHYLDNKKHQIFTNHRVEFFINIALNTKIDNLKDICREMIFNKGMKISSSPKKPFDKLNYNSQIQKSDNRAMEYNGWNFREINGIIERIQENNEDKSVRNDKILHNFAKMDTLLWPYIRMLHTSSDFDYEAADKFITEILDNDDKDGYKLENVELSDHMEIDSPTSDTNNRLNSELPVKTCLETINENPASKPNNVPTEVSLVLPRLPNHITQIENNSELLDDAVLSFIHDSNLNHRVDSEVIEISDEEDESEDLKLKHSDIDQMIDFLIHRCNIQSDRHPSLLKDHQMHVELNGFLLFVNFSIRFSLKYDLSSQDRRIFDCIFISSIIVGLTCLVYINDSGINIERLTNEGFQIVRTRLKSVELPIKDMKKVGDSFSVLINPDITRLMHLTLCYVRGYLDTGELREK